MIEVGGEPGYRRFEASLLQGIILGAKIKDADEDFIRKLLARRQGLRVFRAEIDPDDFRLNIVPEQTLERRKSYYL